MTQELARFYLDSTVSAAEDYRDNLARVSKRFGDSETAARHEGRVIKVSKREAGALAARARIDAAAWVAEIERKVTAALRASVEMGEEPELRAIKAAAVVRAYCEFDDAATAVIEFAARGRPMKRSGRADQRERAKHMPYLKYLKTQLVPDVISAAEKRAKDPKQTPEERAAARKLASNLRKSREGKEYVSNRLKENQQTSRLQTMRTTLRTIRQRDEAEADDSIVGYQYSLGVAKEHTAICLAYNGWVVRKGDPLLNTRRPANHWGCRSFLLPLTRVMMRAMGLRFHTPAKIRYMLPESGFGGY